MLFEDDASVFCSDDNIRSLFQTGMKGKQINGSFVANEISLNVEKIKHVVFHKLTVQDDTSLKLFLLQLNGNIIERENTSELSLLNI